MENVPLIASIFDNFVSIAVVGIVVFALVSFFGKYNKVKKLKSGETPSHIIKGIVSEIKYRTAGKNQSTISSRYFVAKGTDAGSNEEMEFESENFDYKDSWFKIRIMGPNAEDERKLLEYARTFIKEGEMVKIHISNENTDIYYIEDITKSDGTTASNIPQIAGSMAQMFNLGGKNNSLIGGGLKKLKGFIFLIILFFIAPIIISLINDPENGLNLNLPKFNRGMNFDFGGFSLVWIIVALLVIFIIYKLFVGYRGNKK